MRRDIFLPVLAVAGGGAGFVLRRWQLASAYDPETGLFSHGAPATLALLGLLALLALAFLLLSWESGEEPEDFLPAFRCPEAGQMAALAAAGFLLFAAGGFGIRDGFRVLLLWWLDPSFYPFSTPGSLLLAGVLCIPAGFGILLLGRMAYREELSGAACRLAPFPAFAGLVWLFACHLQHGTEPVLMKYGFQLAAVLLLTLAHYFLAGFLFQRPHRRRTVFLSLTGTAVGIVSLADRPGLFTAAATVAFSLSALAFARALLRNTSGPPWPKHLEGRMSPSGEEDGSDQADPKFED